MHNKRFLDNWIVRDILFALLFVAAIVVISNIVLSLTTQHGKTVTVPDMTNLTFQEAQLEAEMTGIRVEIADSVYVRRMKKGVVFSQNPKAGSKVKNGRRVLLTTNAMNPKKVSMPSLIGFSMRQAKAELASKGLALGKLIYVSDMATNNVLKQLYRNREIGDGEPIESGSYIDLVVGLNSDDALTYAPDVVRMKFRRAVDALQENSLNIGRLVFDSSVKNYNDSLNAVVYRQRPEPTGLPVDMGSEVSLFLTVDQLKVPAAPEQ